MTRKRRKSSRLRGRLRAYRRRPDARTPAQSPGTLVHVGDKRAESVTLTIVDYATEVLDERPQATVEQCLAPLPDGVRRWIRVVGLHEVETIGRLLEAAGVHPLIQEDVLNTNHRPKVEAFEDYLFVTLKLVEQEPEARAPGGNGVRVDQISIVVRDRLVISFEEVESDVFAPVRERLSAAGGRLRTAPTDYFCWALLDAVIDNCFPLLDRLEADLEAIDEELHENLTTAELAHIHAVRREIAHVYRLLRPAREVASALLRTESPVLSRETEPFYRDLYEHTVHAIEMCESLRDESGSLRDYYASALGNRMNNIMKVLTAAATVFLPLTFLAGVYGMNFDVMPELHWKYGYFLLWGVFGAVALGLVIFFRRRRWL